MEFATLLQASRRCAPSVVRVSLPNDNVSPAAILCKNWPRSFRRRTGKEGRSATATPTQERKEIKEGPFSGQRNLQCNQGASSASEGKRDGHKLEAKDAAADDDLLPRFRNSPLSSYHPEASRLLHVQRVSVARGCSNRGDLTQIWRFK